MRCHGDEVVGESPWNQHRSAKQWFCDQYNEPWGNLLKSSPGDLGWEHKAPPQYEARILTLEQSLFLLYYPRTHRVTGAQRGAHHRSETRQTLGASEDLVSLTCCLRCKSASKIQELNTTL